MSFDEITPTMGSRGWDNDRSRQLERLDVVRGLA